MTEATEPGGEEIATEIGGSRRLHVDACTRTNQQARDHEACATVVRPVRADSALARRTPKSRAFASPTCG